MDKASTERRQTTQRITLLGAFSNIALSIIKIVGGFYGHSHALIADGIHSLADLITDFVVLFAAKFSSQKADLRYPYGYARVETLATAILALLLLITGLGIIYNAGDSLFAHKELFKPSLYVLVIALLSLLIKEFLFRYTLKFAKQLNSSLLQANAWHHRSDAASSLIVLIGIIGSLFGYLHLDALASTVVALMIIKMGWELTSSSVKELIDVGLDPITLNNIQQTTLAAAGVRSIHQLRSRSMGGQIFLDMHILVSPYLSVSEGHYIAARVHRELMRTIPNLADATIHIDPENDEESDTTISVLDLPPRNKLIPLLKAHWASLLPEEAFKKINLDYLSGKIRVTVKIPANHCHQLEEGVFLLKKLKEAIHPMPYITKVILELEYA